MNALVTKRKNSSAQLKVRNTLVSCSVFFFSFLSIILDIVKLATQGQDVRKLLQPVYHNSHLHILRCKQMHLFTCILRFLSIHAYIQPLLKKKTNSTTYTQRPLHLSTSLIREQTLLIYLLLLSFLQMTLCYKKQQHFNLL